MAVAKVPQPGKVDVKSPRLQDVDATIPRPLAVGRKVVRPCTGKDRVHWLRLVVHKVPQSGDIGCEVP